MEFDDLPESLVSLFGQPEHVMDLELTPERPLAREDVTQVISNLEEQGFFLQLPPSIIEEPRVDQ